MNHVVLGLCTVTGHIFSGRARLIALKFLPKSLIHLEELYTRQKTIMAQRARVIELYKTLLHLGRDYPQGYDYFRVRCHNAFMKNRDVTLPGELETLMAKAEYVVKELEALYMLKKYRTLKRRYYPDPQQKD